MKTNKTQDEETPIAIGTPVFHLAPERALGICLQMVSEHKITPEDAFNLLEPLFVEEVKPSSPHED